MKIRGTRVDPEKKKLSSAEIDALILLTQYPEGVTTRWITDKFDLPEDHIRRGISVLVWLDLVQATTRDLYKIPYIETYITTKEPVYHINNSVIKDRVYEVLNDRCHITVLAHRDLHLGLYPFKEAVK